MQTYIDKASHLVEALPYIRRFSGKIFVVKCGGAAMVTDTALQSIMQDIALLYFCGIRPVIVHGGGPEISAMCERLQIPTQFAQGQRVTDAATMEIVQMVLSKTNSNLVTALNRSGINAIGISGQDASCLQAKKFTSEDNTIDLGFVGEITTVNATFVKTLLAGNFLPVISPVGIDQHGQFYNINADIAAGAIAGALAAEKLLVLSDVNGIYADVKNPATRLSALNAQQLKDMLQEKILSGGMIPKLQACLQALERGVPSAHILDGKMPHSLLLEIFTDQGIGTLITQ